MAIMTMHTLIRMIPGDRFRDTARFVSEINRRLCDNSIVQTEGGFITLFYAAIDTATNVMRWTSAGHPLPLLLQLDSGEVAAIGDESAGDMPLAITSDMDYTAGELVLTPGSRVALFTDGLTDAFPMEGSARNPFGISGIRAALQASRETEVDEALRLLLEASHRFTHGSGRHDDTTVVLLDCCADGQGHASKQ
jgi:serine phosphatase RsbU (regulator of sigma subunit)